eukprot:1140280-Pelagomonas_calceolata.AAC.1
MVLVQEYCATDLASLLKKQHCRMPERCVKGLMQQMLRGLAACHAAGEQRRKKRKNHVGREDSPYISGGRGNTLAGLPARHTAGQRKRKPEKPRGQRGHSLHQWRKRQHIGRSASMPRSRRAKEKTGKTTWAERTLPTS